MTESLSANDERCPTCHAPIRDHGGLDLKRCGLAETFNQRLERMAAGGLLIKTVLFYLDASGGLSDPQHERNAEALIARLRERYRVQPFRFSLGVSSWDAPTAQIHLGTNFDSVIDHAQSYDKSDAHAVVVYTDGQLPSPVVLDKSRNWMFVLTEDPTPVLAAQWCVSTKVASDGEILSMLRNAIG